MAISVKRQIDYWLTTASSDLESAKIYLKSAKNLHWCLFMLHLVLEKTLKALVVKTTGRTPPYSHDLILPSRKAKFEPDKEMKSFLELMNRFVIEARYPDEKNRIYKLATESFTRSCLAKTEEYQSDIEKLVKQ